MSKKKSLRTNRLISIFSLVIFIFSLVLFGVVATRIINEYQINIQLENEKEVMIKEQEHLKSLTEKFNDDSTYYSVYYKNGNRFVFDNGDVVIIFS